MNAPLSACRFQVDPAGSIDFTASHLYSGVSIQK